MTFDDGVLEIYQTINASEKGDKPNISLRKKDAFYFGYDTVGITRYYTAMQAGQKISAVVNIPDWPDISSLDICVLEDEEQYRIVMKQKTKDENGLKITKLSLERLNEEYNIKA